MARHLSRIISVALVPLGLFAFAVVSWADISAFDIKKPTGEIRHGEEVQIEWLHSQLLTNKIIIELRGAKKTKGKHSDIFSEECLKNKGSCTWVVPAGIDPGHYRITITSTKNKQNYIKGPVFTIVGDVQESDDKPSTSVEHEASCTGGAGRVLVPKLAANWAQGSTVMLEWRPNDDNELVDLYLDCDAFAIAKDVPDKGYYLWKIPNKAPTGKNKTISVLPVEDDAAGVTSKKFALQAWTEAERYRGRDQRYDSDLSDRPRVTSPVEGSRYPRGEPPILRWDDPDHLLLDQIRIELYQHHTAKEILRWNHKNTGVFEVPDDRKKRIKRFCRQIPGCYFVVYSRRHTERRIASGHFLLGKDKKASPESFAVRLLPAGTDPEGVAESLSEVTMGDKVQIRWNDLTAANRPVRVELRKDDLHYLTIADAIESTADGDNVRDWVIPYGALPDEGYSISITLADDATVTAESPVFLLQGEADNRMSLNEIPDSAWELKTGRTIVPIQWKKPARVSALRVDLYRAGRRVKTISDSATKRRTDWSVPRPLPSGADYQIRIQELIEGDTGDQSHFAFSDPFCI
ncbi:MAG TPA: hypothetical protein EYP91_03300, partial [Gammaproteobacteria bacterium]|nr:hypothetical protein [Gammaproteobacteria bacterium]